jgi:16S rRNA (guanine527-N7)-methyltransferase
LTVEPPESAAPALDALLGLLRSDPSAPISRGSARSARDVHIADSLSGLGVPDLAGAGRIADIGSGAGLPGLALAACLPDARVALIESRSSKCAFLRRAVERMALANAEVVCERAESWAAGEGREAYDAVTARAVGPLATLAELASPLLRDGGVLVAWKGSRDPDEEAEAARAAAELAIEPVATLPATPYPGSRDRHIHVLRKNGPTPNELPRRPGMAAKRPFGSESK